MAFKDNIKSILSMPVKDATKGDTAPMVEWCVRQIIKFIGEDPNREGLLDTPSRVRRAYAELFSGYKQNPADILKTTFVGGACDEMVVCKDITGYSMCEHHLLPFSYTAHIGYLPDGKVVGLSKMARLVELYGRRAQIQERFTSQTADAMMEVLQPKGVMVVIEGKHLCMAARGVKQPDAAMVTSAIRGIFKEHTQRTEFLRLIGK